MTEKYDNMNTGFGTYSGKSIWLIPLLIAALISPLSLYLGFYLEQRKQKTLQKEWGRQS